MRRESLHFLIVFVVSVIFLQGIFLISLVSFSNSAPSFPTAMATGDGAIGDLSFCFNVPPTLDFSNCASDINQSTRIEDNALECYVEASHREDVDVVVSSHSSSTDAINYSIDEEGNIFFNATYKIFDHESDPTNFSIDVYAEVFEPCRMVGSDTFDVTVHQINDPPEFFRDINGSSMRPRAERGINLENYAYDPDGDPLKFSYSLEGRGRVSIEDGLAYVSNIDDVDCDPIFVVFFAEDPYGLSDESNIIRIDALCGDDVPDETDSGGLGGAFDPCEHNWKCGEWGECLPNGTQSRVCEDLHRCDEDDYIKTFWRDCDYIPPEYPEDDVELEVDPDATCFDGVQNCHVLDDGSIICEEGVDCGGPCEPCRRIESPGIVFDEEADNTLLFFALVIVFLSVLITVYFIYKKQILSTLAKIGWWLTRKKRKQFLLKAHDKEELLVAVNALYDKVKNSSNSSFNRKSAELRKTIGASRGFLARSLWLPEEFSSVDFKKGISRRVLNDSLKNGMSLYGESLFKREKKSSVLSKQELLNFIQETRMLILNTSKLAKQDFNFKALELDAPIDALGKAQVLIHNAYLALCFSEVVSAQKNYYELLGLYEEMSEEDKVKVYYELSKIYSYTKTILSWV